MLKRTLHWAAGGLIAIVVFISAAYIWDMKHYYERINGKSTVIASPYGHIEYTEGGGSGPTVLVIHGSGGVYDQGKLIAQAVLGMLFHWIIPSRFGYLRSTVSKAATWDEQAHAYAYLLKQLGTAVVAMSHRR